MIEESLYKTAFLGRDGFRWWIGQIPPIESQKGQANGAGWGNRVKVRILGYHPYSTAELPNDDLPWAQILMSPNTGSGAANYATNHKLRPGDVVFGFFLDGDNGQLPVITGIFGRTDQVPSSTFLSPFVPYTGYTERIPQPDKTLHPSEAAEDKKNAQKSPRDVPPDVAQQINIASEYKDELYYFSGVGKKIVVGNTSTDTLSKGIGAEVGNLLQKVNDVTNKVLNVAAEISRTVDKVVGIANGFVSQCINSLYTQMIPLLQQGLDILYKTVYAQVLAATQSVPAAHAAGVAAQTAMVGPVKTLQGFIPKAFGTVVNSLFSMVEGMVSDVVKNAKKFRSCVEEQFTGSLLNGIIGKIESVLSGPLQGVSKILSAAFSVGDFLRSGVSAIRAVNGLFNAFQHKNKSVGHAEEWTIGMGINDGGNDASKFEGILGAMNTANAIAKSVGDLTQSVSSGIGAVNSAVNTVSSGVSDIKSGFDIFSSNTKSEKSKCFTGPKKKGGGAGGGGGCSGPKVKIFGGSGKGASAEVIMGSFNKKSDETTGGIIGIKVKKKGKNYKHPPFVEIVDDCEQGYGAVARSVINDKGEVIAIYIVSEGENYPVGNININISETISETDPENIPTYVSEVIVVDPGYNYSPTDTAYDDFGNQYTITTDDDGSIVSVNITAPEVENTSSLPDTVWESQITPSPSPTTPSIITGVEEVQPTGINKYIIVDTLPIITIESETGLGAVLKPILEKLPIEEIQKAESFVRGSKYVKDCI